MASLGPAPPVFTAGFAPGVGAIFSAAGGSVVMFAAAAEPRVIFPAGGGTGRGFADAEGAGPIFFAPSLWWDREWDSDFSRLERLRERSSRSGVAPDRSAGGAFSPTPSGRFPPAPTTDGY